MLETKKEKELFYRGIEYFNENSYTLAHTTWESLWKLIGLKPRRSSLKVFLQLTAMAQNIKLKKWDAVRYGLKVGNIRFEENINAISDYVEVNSIVNFFQLYKDKELSLKVIDEIQIKKKGVEFTKTSELSERLPLPHTKGTKPAP